MDRILFAIGIIAVSVIAAVGVASGTWIFWDVWKSGDRDVYKALIGGFAGAFFAFLFVRLGEGLKRLLERQERNHSSLVKAEHYLNYCLSITGDNIFIIEDFATVLSEKHL